MPATNNTKHTPKDLKTFDFNVLNKIALSEEKLRHIANYLNTLKNRGKIVESLINKINNSNRSYDWNVGSILQHLDIDIIIGSLKKLEWNKLHNSIGLVWVLGEFKNTNRIIIDFLYSAIEKATDQDAWWRAAFSLEKLGVTEAVNLLKMSLKNEKLNSLDFYLNHLEDKKSIISILILSNVDNIEKDIYPKIKSLLFTSDNDKIIINCCWLIGRLKLVDGEIYEKLVSLIRSKNYKLSYYTFFALQNNATEILRPIMEESLLDQDPLIRKMAARGLLSIGNEESLNILNKVLYKEQEESVISEISKAIYYLKNPIDRNKLLIEIKSCRNENGMISDESDKWYSDPSVYNIFSESEDPENICFNLILKKIKGIEIRNPIDLATGTGRMMWQIMENMSFKGTLTGVDSSEQMCDFVNKAMRRERKYTNSTKIIQSITKDASEKIKIKSNFIISSFGFPSKIKNQNLCIQELRSVYNILDDDGLFFTIGWDETFNDELNTMWFKYVPDDIHARDFEEWRKKRISAISSPRNCGLTWFKKGVQVPLQFSSLKESAFVMGYLFGRDAAQYIVNTGQTEWSMSMGITCNTKQEIKEILKKL